MIEYWQISYALTGVLVVCITAFVLTISRLGKKDD